MCIRLWDQLRRPRLYQRQQAIDVIRMLTNSFLQHGIAEPDLSAKYLVGYVTHGKPIFHNFMLTRKYLNFKQAGLLKKLYKKRLAKVPIQYIIGQWYFYNDNILLKMQQPVFIPRPETEYLVNLAQENIHTYFQNMVHHKDSICKILEIGCGSGAISLALLKCLPEEERKYVSCVAIDTNLKAVELTRENALHLGVELSVLHETITETGIESLNLASFHLIISNPPYLCTAEIDQLQDEVKRYEDHRSLIGGEDGLDVVHYIIRYAQHSLKPGGKLLLEVSLTHPQIISSMIQSEQYFPLQLRTIHKDFTERNRFMEIISQKL